MSQAASKSVLCFNTANFDNRFSKEEGFIWGQVWLWRYQSCDSLGACPTRSGQRKSSLRRVFKTGQQFLSIIETAARPSSQKYWSVPGCGSARAFCESSGYQTHIHETPTSAIPSALFIPSFWQFDPRSSISVEKKAGDTR